MQGNTFTWAFVCGIQFELQSLQSKRMCHRAGTVYISNINTRMGRNEFRNGQTAVRLMVVSGWRTE